MHTQNPFQTDPLIQADEWWACKHCCSIVQHKKTLHICDDLFQTDLNDSFELFESSDNDTAIFPQKSLEPLVFLAFKLRSRFSFTCFDPPNLKTIFKPSGCKFPYVQEAMRNTG